MTTNIYILSLEGGRYYIGKSNNVINRYQQHLDGNGSAWTRKYRPISLERTIEGVSPFEEDKLVKEYMLKYGIDKVRGGSYVEIELSDFHKDALKMEIWNATDKCSQCGRPGHFIKNCFANNDIYGDKIIYETNNESKTTLIQSNANNSANCMRISNQHPEHLAKEQVLDVFIEYIKKYQNTYDIYDIPVGTKYLNYASYIYNELQKIYPNITWKILYKTDSQYVCRGELNVQ